LIFYILIACDLDKYGVFSNGALGEVDSTVTRPPTGMFFGPVFPMPVFAVSTRVLRKLYVQHRSQSGLRNGALCTPDEMPIRLANAVLFAIGLFAWCQRPS
jgi:hypothetical protein